MNNAQHNYPARPTPAYYQLYHTLDLSLPPPVDDTPEAATARTHAAIDKVGAMMPADANEADLAAQCVATRAQAEHLLQQARQHAGDITLAMKINAQYTGMVRASLAVLGRLQRTQAIRRKREADEPALKADTWTQHVVVSSMEQARDAGRGAAAQQSALAFAAEPLAPVAEQSGLAARAMPDALPTAAALAAAPPPAPETLPTLPADTTAWSAFAAMPSDAPSGSALAPAGAAPPPPVTALPAASSPRSHGRTPAVEADDPPRDLLTEAGYYAHIYPRRAREIRRLGGLPPDCSYGPPDEALMHAIINGTSAALRDLDASDTATG